MAGEKTEAPTARKREDARNKGQVARSMEISSVAILLTGLLMLSYMGGNVLVGYRVVAREAFMQVGVRDAQPQALLALAASLIGVAAATMTPIVLAIAIVGVAINLVQVGPMLSVQPMKPDPNRVNPLRGLQRLFSTRSLVELAKAAVKLAVAGFIAYQVIMERFPELVALQAASAEGALVGIGSLMMEIGLKCGLALAVMAVLDYAYQRRSHEGSLKMTRRELKDEARQSEGDPQQKGRLRQMARQMTSRRMMDSVPNADVVVTNPVHLAVALEYRQDRMQAPMVTAKGQLLVAERIKLVAREHGVPVVENPPLARALYRSAEVGMAVPPALYQAVAEVLAFIYRLRSAGC